MKKPLNLRVEELETRLAPAVVTGDLVTWHKATLTFDGPQTSENAAVNPFTDYRLNVNLTSPTGRQVVAPGYFAADGNAANTSATAGNKWRAHFTPDEAGTWTYTASFRTGSNVAISLDVNAGTAASFNGETGAFTIAAGNPNSGNPLDRGLVRYVGEHYLQYAGTGEYYLKAGADSPENFLGYWEFDNTFDNGGISTPGLIDGLHRYANHVPDWQAGDPTWQNGEGKGIIGALNYLASEGMNSVYFLTYNLDGGDGRDTWMWTTTSERLRYDVSKLEQWEIVFSHMDKLGIQLHVVTQETENDGVLDGGNLGTIRQLYYRELVARFSHHQNVIWNLGEENDNSDAQRKQFAAYLRAQDPYDHPITVHTHYNAVISTYDGLVGDPNFEATSIQGDGSNYNAWATQVRTMSANAGRKWAVYGDEQGPAVASNMSNLTQLRRDTLWGNLMGGGAGVEWYWGYQGSFGDVQSEDWRSADPLWDMTRYAVDFFQDQLPFATMTPNNALTSASNDYAFAKAGEVYAIYLKTGGTTNLDLSGVSGTFSVQWYNPRTGGALQNGTVTSVTGGGQAAIGLAPSDTGNDWVALVRRTSTGGTAPAAPGALVASVVSSSQINLAWLDNSGNETGFEIQRATNSAFTSAVVTSSVGANVTGTSITGLAAGTTYYFRVRSFNAAGASAWSNTVTAATQPPATSLAVTSLTLINADTDQDIGTLTSGQTLNLATLPTRNLSVRANVSGTVGSVRFALDGNSNFATENVAPYAIAGDNNGNYNAWTPAVGAHTLKATPYSAAGAGGTAGTALTVTFTVIDQVPTAPAAPSNLNASAVSSSQVNLTWLDNSGNETGFEIQRATNSAFTSAVVTSSVGANVTGTSITGLAAGTTYYFRVRSFNAAGASAWSNTVTAATQPPATSLAVTSLTLINADTDQDIGTLTSGQTLNLATLPTRNLSVRANVAGAVQSVRFGLDGNANYQTESVVPYAIAGDNNGNYNAWTPAVGNHTLTATPYSAAGAGGTAGTALTVTFTVIDQAPTVPAAPTNLAASAVSSSQVNLTWSDNSSNENGFAIERSTGDGAFAQIATVAAGVTTYSNTGLSAGTAYTYRLRAFNAVGNSTFSNSASATTLPSSIAAVVRFVLVNADTNQDIMVMTPGMTLNLATLPTRNLNIRADVSGTVESVRFALDGNLNYRTENVAVYALAGDTNGNFNAWTPALGTHTLTATPWTLDNAGGLAGTALTLSFNVVDR